MTEEISQQQLLEYAEAFSMYDVEDSGSIPVEQLDLVLKTTGQRISEARLLALQQQKLAEGEAKITFEEFLYLLQVGSTTSGYEDEHASDRSRRLRKALSLFDTQNAGVISVVDIRKALREALQDSEIDELIQMADPKGTGKIDCEYLAELVVGM